MLAFAMAVVMLCGMAVNAQADAVTVTYSIFDAIIPFKNMVDCQRTTYTTVGTMQQLNKFTYVYSGDKDKQIHNLVPDVKVNPDNYYYKFSQGSGEKIVLTMYKYNDSSYSYVLSSNGSIQTYGDNCFLYVAIGNANSYGCFVSFRDKEYHMCSGDSSHNHNTSKYPHENANKLDSSRKNCILCGCGETYIIRGVNPSIDVLKNLPLVEGLVEIEHEHQYDPITGKCPCGDSKISEYQITKAAASNGSFTVKANGSEVTAAAKNTAITIAATPNAGYLVDTVTVSGTGAVAVSGPDANGKYTFTMPAEAVTVAVSFIKPSEDWTVAQETANSAAEVKTWIENQLPGMNLTGAAVTVTSVTPATAGDMYDQDGTDGSFTFTLSRGGAEVTNIPGAITATPSTGTLFVPVTSITDVPTSATAGVDLTLSGTVNPDDATFKDIVWTVKDDAGTGAVIENTTFKATQAGKAVVTATIAGGKSKTEDFVQDFEIEVSVKLTGIAITKVPDKTEYAEGENFDPAGMVVTASYSNGTTQTVTGYAYAPGSNLKVEDTAVTVSYTEDGVTKTAQQPITVLETFVVSFYPNGGTGTMDPQVYVDGRSQALTPNAFTKKGYEFVCWNTNADGSGDTFADKATVTVSSDVKLYAQWNQLNPPKFVTQPKDQTVPDGTSAHFSVEATGDGLSYQWFISRSKGLVWEAIDGATSAKYTTSPTDILCNGFQYKCVITDEYGNSLTSDAATLTVVPMTGDSANPLLWLVLSVLSLTGILFMRRKAYNG